jgi:hypothetical protein
MSRDDQLAVMNMLLRSAGKMIDAAMTLSRDYRPDLPQDFVRRGATILGQLSKLEEDIWNIEPALAAHWASPEGGARDVDSLLDALNGAEEESRLQASEVLSTILPRSLLVRIPNLDDPKSREEIRRWWALEPKPYVPVHQLKRHLADKRRYLRILAAAYVAKRFGVDLLNALRTDVDPQKEALWSSTAE